MWDAKQGETPLEDLSELKPRLTNPTRSSVEKFEAMNIAKAYEKYFARRLTPTRSRFDVPWLKRVHQDMFGDVWRWAGEFRQDILNIGVTPTQINMDLLHLMDDLSAWPDMGMDWLEQAVHLHHRAVQIHPFKNGNGCWSRMISNIWLKKNNQPLVQWPVTVDRESPIRGAYIAALRNADKADYTDLIALHRQYQEN